MSDFTDVSSNNPLPDVAKLRAAGHELIAIKATEGLHYTWTDGDGLAERARRAGLVVVRYHFARPGSSGVEQARYFLDVCSPSDVPCLDLEGANWAAGEAARVCRDFCATVEAQRGPGIVYSGAYFITETRAAYPKGWAWWLPAYASAPPAPPAGWPQPWAWQYTDHGKADGMGAPGDLSHLYGPPDPRPRAASKPTQTAPGSGITYYNGGKHTGHPYPWDGHAEQPWFPKDAPPIGPGDRGDRVSILQAHFNLPQTGLWSTHKPDGARLSKAIKDRKHGLGFALPGPNVPDMVSQASPFVDWRLAACLGPDPR